MFNALFKVRRSKEKKKIQILAFQKKNKKNVFRVFKNDFLTPLTQRRERAFSLSLDLLLARALCFVCLEEEEEETRRRERRREKQLRASVVVRVVV